MYDQDSVAELLSISSAMDLISETIPLAGAGYLIHCLSARIQKIGESIWMEEEERDRENL